MFYRAAISALALIGLAMMGISLVAFVTSDTSVFYVKLSLFFVGLILFTIGVAVMAIAEHMNSIMKPRKEEDIVSVPKADQPQAKSDSSGISTAGRVFLILIGGFFVFMAWYAYASYPEVKSFVDLYVGSFGDIEFVTVVATIFAATIGFSLLIVGIFSRSSKKAKQD